MSRFLLKTLAVIILCSAFFVAYLVIAADSNSQSVEFDPANSEQCSKADDNTTSITGDMTIEAWVKMYADPASGAVYGIVGKNNCGAVRCSYSFDYFNNSGVLNLQIRLSALGATTVDRFVAKKLISNKWYYLAVVYDSAAGSATFYAKEEGGELEKVGDTQTGLPTSINDNVSDFQIGGTDDAAKFSGLVDEVRLWSKQRTRQELEESSDKELLFPIGGLQGYFRLNGNGNDDAQGNAVSCSAGARFTDAKPDRSQGFGSFVDTF